jgi:hypothetical protein
MAEQVKGRKITLREIMDEIADDEELNPEELESDREKLKDLEFRDKLRQEGQIYVKN